MEKIGSFIPDEIKEQPKKGPNQYIDDEIIADMSVFPQDVQKIIQRGVGAPMTATEQSRYHASKRQWWENKYGFPYEVRAARNELIMRKYAAPNEVTAAHALQKELLDAYANDDKAGIEKLKRAYLEHYPDQLEGVEALFGLEQFFKDQSEIDASRAAGQRSKERAHLYQHVTEYNFLLTDFIRSNGDDKEFLQKFWEVLEALAQRTDHLKMFHKLQRAIVTQVATGKIFEAIGEKPRLSHPSEDAFKAIDLWTEGAAVQIKGTTDRRAGFLKTDEVSFPGIEITREDIKKQAKTYHINSHMFHEAQRFHAKLSEYRKLVKKDVEGYFLVVPYNKIDFITGEPAPDLIAFVKEQVQATFQ